MGQYYKVVNLDKHEYLHGHDLGTGVKAWEWGANPQLGHALSLLLVNSPEKRGGGDFSPTVEGAVGRWAGDRILLAGDYAEDEDVESIPHLSLLYSLCDDDRAEYVSYLREQQRDAEADWVQEQPLYRNISKLILPEIEKQFAGF